GHALWRNRFAQDPAVVGRQVRLNGRPATIVGVMPEGFRFPRMQQVWLPMVLDGTVQPRAAAVDVEAFGRLAPGSSLAAARAGLDALLARINAAHPELLRSERTLVEPYAQWMMGEDVRQVLYTMFAAVLLVLLIACANVANLMLARGLGRARELAIRGALGAARRRLMLQVLCESLLIAMAAAVLGLLGAWLGGEATMRAIHGSGDAPVYWQRFSMDAATVPLCVAVALVAAVAAGVLPALQAARTPVAQSMRSGGSGAIGARRGGIGRTLAVVQIALCMVLLVGAGLTVRSVLKVQSVDLGVDTANVLTGRIGLFEADYPDGDAQRQAIASLPRTLEAIPGVRPAA